MVKNNEILWNVFYTLKFWTMIWGREKAPEKEAYAFEHRWRPLDTTVKSELSTYEIPRAAPQRPVSARAKSPVQLSGAPDAAVGSTTSRS